MFSAWTSIEKLSTALTRVRKSNDCQSMLDRLEDVVTYRGKIKLHGTNAGVSFEAGDGWFATQGRKRLLRPGQDQDGFSAWVHEHEAFWRALQARCEPMNEQLAREQGLPYERHGEREKETVRVYGEWCGRGIMKKVAIALIDTRLFCVFALKIGQRMVVEPEEIAKVLCVPVARPPGEESGATSTGSHYEGDEGEIVLGGLADGVAAPAELKVLPWQTRAFECDVRVAAELGTLRGLDEMNAIVDDVDAVDPWVRAHYGVEAPGEGIVWYPVHPERLCERVAGVRAISAGVVTPFMFKAKGDSHLVVKQKRPIQVHVEVPESVFAFLDQFLTENRYEQGLREACDGEFAMEKVGDFVKWLCEDVHKESAAERESNADVLAWSKVKKLVCKRGSQWYRDRIPEVAAE